MAATTGYQAGVESNDTQLSYAQESVYGVLPAVQFQAIRYTGETLAGTKQRSRPGEVLSTGEVAAAVTTQESAGGNINFALSYGTFDDLLAGALNSDWSALRVINGAAGNIAASAGSLATGVSLTGPSNTWTGLNIGQWVRFIGFTQPALNGIFRIANIDGNSAVLLVQAYATTAPETPAGAAAGVRASNIRNGRVFKSFHLQTAFSPSLFFRYPGSYVTGFTLSGGVGQFLSGSFTFMSQNETSFTVNASTGAVIAAPVGRVHDPVNGFTGVFLDGLPIAAVVDSFSISVSATGAKQEYGMGSAAAQGQIMGLLEAKGTLKVYFKDAVLYNRFKNETQGTLSFVTRDPSGNAYVVSLLTANILNPSVDASGPSTAVMATFQLEGNPGTGAFPNVFGGTIQIDRLAGA